jgi:hypothetical protein
LSYYFELTEPDLLFVLSISDLILEGVFAYTARLY